MTERANKINKIKDKIKIINWKKYHLTWKLKKIDRTMLQVEQAILIIVGFEIIYRLY